MSRSQLKIPKLVTVAPMQRGYQIPQMHATTISNTSYLIWSYPSPIGKAWDILLWHQGIVTVARKGVGYIVMALLFLIIYIKTFDETPVNLFFLLIY